MNGWDFEYMVMIQALDKVQKEMQKTCLHQSNRNIFTYVNKQYHKKQRETIENKIN